MKILPQLKKDLLLTCMLAMIAIALGSFTGWITLNDEVSQVSVEAQLAELESRTIIGYEAFGNDDRSVVRYSFLGDKMPEKLADNEVLEKRTESSWTVLFGYENKGTSQEKTILSLVTYPQQTFSKQPDGWYYVEYGETSQEAMEKHKEVNPVQALFWNVAHAASATVYSGAGDGYVGYAAGADCSTQWATVHGAATGTFADITFTSAAIQVDSNAGKIPSCSIYRTFLPFDTSAIPASATISAATLNVYPTSVSNFDNDGADYLTVVQTSQSTDTTLATSDYDLCGSVSSPTEGVDSGQRKDLTSVSVSTYLTFTLNTTGQGWIKKAGQSSACSGTNGISCFGIREGHDTTNSAAVSTNVAVISTSEETGTAQDPYLSVTYTASSFSFWQFQDF